MPVDPLNQSARAARVLQIVHLAFERVQLLTHGLAAGSRHRLGMLHLPQLHIMLLDPLIQIQTAAA